MEEISDLFASSQTDAVLGKESFFQHIYNIIKTLINNGKGKRFYKVITGQVKVDFTHPVSPKDNTLWWVGKVCSCPLNV